MTDIAAIAALGRANAARWATMKLDPARSGELERAAHRLTAPDAKARYQAIEKGCGVPWFIVAVIHEREAGGPPHWDVHLGQGDPLGKRTVNVPAGRGPFFGSDAFYRGALDALMDCPPYAARNTDWSVGGALALLERYNGLAYAGHGVPSPYIWSGSDRYRIGKVMVDHGPIEPVVDEQLGCAPLLKTMMGLDGSIRFGTPAGTPAKPAPVPMSVPPTDATKHGTGAVIAAGGAAAAGAAYYFGFGSGVVVGALAVGLFVAMVAWLVIHETQKGP